MYQIPAPEQFSFRPDDWQKWIDRFERFRSASGLKSKAEEEQVNSLVYLMGSQAEEILSSFNLSTEDIKHFDVVKNKFETHFIPTRNIIYERYKFYTRTQDEGESVEQFITSLYTLVQTCEFPASFQEEMIRDRIVCGIRDKKVSENLQLDTKLTLEKAITTARQAETIKNQQHVLSDNPVSFKIANRVSMPQNKNNKRNARSKCSKNVDYSNSDMKKDICFWCGKPNKHKKEECPARKAICNRCKKIGHYAKACKTKLHVNEVETKKSANSSDFLGYIMNTSNKNNPVRLSNNHWNAKIFIEKTPIEFKIDTGADVIVVPKIIYDSKLKHIQLKRSNKIICGPDGGNLELAGKIHVKLKNKNFNYEDDVYIINNLQHSLLSCTASENLNIVQRIFELKSKLDPVKELPKLFKGIGKVEKPYRIKLKKDAKPYAISVPRRVPLALRSKLKKLIDEMSRNGIIEPVDEATEWCAPMVIVPKKSGDIRICVDLSVLNENIDREYFPMASVDYTLSQFTNAKMFSIIDANAGFWQITLDPDSANLTTFITPFGRYKFKRLPFGIKTAPEVFQKKIRETIQEGPGIVGLMDEFVIFGSTEEEHNERLYEVLSKLQAAGWTLNAEKCQFAKKSIHFLGHIISEKGIKPDPEKTKSISRIPIPTNMTELKRFLGMAGFLNKFVPNFADAAKPLYELLKNNVEWIWGQSQNTAFEEIKQKLCLTPELALYDPKKQTFISADASSYGIGSVLCQKDNGNLRPVFYASRTLSDTEKRYAQIEKEALAIVWACERFHDFIVGLEVDIETDHKPLVPILMSKPLDNLTPRLQRMKLRMMRYSYTVRYTPGKKLIIADTLSRSPLPEKGQEELSEEITAYVQMIVDNFPSSDVRLAEIWSLQKEDPICKLLIEFSKNGWPEKNKIPEECLRYWEHRHSISIENDLLMKDTRIIIPAKLREEILNRIHDGHLGITKCRARARESVWWPGLSSEIENLVSKCHKCIQHQKYLKEPLLPSAFPNRPWQTVGVDLLKVSNHWYLIMADYYSRYIEVAKLENLTSDAVINHMKSIFARHGIPEVVRSDNGTQFSQKIIDSKYRKFAYQYKFSIVTSSPKHAQSNGFIESMVKSFKLHYLKSENDDPYLMLLALRTTALENGHSPAELLMGRCLRTPIPTVSDKLKPKILDEKLLFKKEEERIEKQKYYFNCHHRARQLPQLNVGQQVWISDMRTYGKVKSAHQAPRSYIVETPRGILRRNRIYLHPSPVPKSFVWKDDDVPMKEVCASDDSLVKDDSQDRVPTSVPVTTSHSPNAAVPETKQASPYKTRSGRTVRAPSRLIEKDF